MIILLLLLRERSIVSFKNEQFWALRSRNLMEKAAPENFASSFPEVNC